MAKGRRAWSCMVFFCSKLKGYVCGVVDVGAGCDESVSMFLRDAVRCFRESVR
jgi:hypothetical protein